MLALSSTSPQASRVSWCALGRLMYHLRITRGHPSPDPDPGLWKYVRQASTISSKRVLRPTSPKPTGATTKTPAAASPHWASQTDTKANNARIPKPWVRRLAINSSGQSLRMRSIHRGKHHRPDTFTSAARDDKGPSTGKDPIRPGRQRSRLPGV